MKSTFLIIASFLLLVALAVVHATLKAKEHKNKVLSFEQQIKRSQSAFYESLYYNANDVKINTQKFINELLDTIDLKTFFYGKEQKLVLRIKENHCMDCVDSVLSRLLNFASALGDEKVILLGSYTNINDIIRLKQIRNLPFKMYNSTATLFKGEENIDELPFFFLLDSSMNVKCLYSIKTEHSAMTDIYLKTIKQHLDEEYNIQAPLTTTKITSIRFDKLSFDLGEIAYADSAVAIAGFRNMGNKPLFLTAVTTDCGCTVASFLKKPIPPGDSSFISIEYDSRREGAFHRDVFVYSNAKESPVLLQIKGRIKERH